MEEKKTKNGKINSRARNNWLLPKKVLRSHNAWCHDAFRIENGKTSTNYILRRRLSHLNCLAKALWRMTTFERGFQRFDTILQFPISLLFHFIQFNFRNLNAINLIFYFPYECWTLACDEVYRIYIIIPMGDLHELHTAQWTTRVGLEWNEMGTRMFNVERSVNIMANDDLHRRI